MKKIIKIVLYLLGTAVLAFALLIGYFAMNRDEIHDRILVSMREQLQAKVEFDKLDFSLFRDFPAVSIELKNVLIADSLYATHHVPLIKSKSLFLETSLLNLITLNLSIHKIILKDAALNIFKTCDEYSNDYILKNLSKKKEKPPTEPKDKSKAEFEIEKVGLYNVGISIRDSVRDKYFGFNFKDVKIKLNKAEKETNIFLAGNIYMNGLTFKLRKGTFVQNQNIFLDAHFHIGETQGLVEIMPSKLNIGKAHYDLKGYINTNGDGDLKLMFHNDAVLLADTKKILTQKIYSKLAKFSFLGPVNADVTIQTRLKNAPRDPYITVNASAREIPLSLAGNEIDSATFKGTFKNYIDTLTEPGDVNSTIIFPEFSAVANGIHINGVVKVISFENTQLELDLNGQGELNKLQNFMNENAMAIKGGTLDFKINFKANVINPYDSINDKMDGAIQGNIAINNGSILNVSKKLTLSNINSTMDIDSKGLHIRQLHVNAPGSDLNITADIDKLILFLFSDKSKLTFNCKLNSDNLNLEPLFADAKVTPETPAKPVKKKKQIEQTVANSIDRILTQSEMEVAFNVKHVYAKKFNAYNGTGKINIDNNSVTISEFAFAHANGKIKYDAMLTKKSNNYEAKFTASVVGVSMPEFMEAFENFNQKSLTQKNINGIVNLNINASCGITSGFKVLPNTLRGDMKLNIVNGQLNNFEPLINLSKYIFKNRGLDSVSFTTLSCNADMRGTEIYFDKLYVLSSAISLAMDGIYSFGDSTDLSIQVPLKNLESKSPEYFSSVESFEKYKGANVFIRGKTKDGKLSFSYDPMKKLRKKKK